MAPGGVQGHQVYAAPQPIRLWVVGQCNGSVDGTAQELCEWWSQARLGGGWCMCHDHHDFSKCFWFLIPIDAWPRVNTSQIDISRHSSVTLLYLGGTVVATDIIHSFGCFRIPRGLCLTVHRMHVITCVTVSQHPLTKRTEKWGVCVSCV